MKHRCKENWRRLKAAAVQLGLPPTEFPADDEAAVLVNVCGPEVTSMTNSCVLLTDKAQLSQLYPVDKRLEFRNPGRIPPGMPHRDLIVISVTEDHVLFKQLAPQLLPNVTRWNYNRRQMLATFSPNHVQAPMPRVVQHLVVGSMEFRPIHVVENQHLVLESNRVSVRRLNSTTIKQLQEAVSRVDQDLDRAFQDNETEMAHVGVLYAEKRIIEAQLSKLNAAPDTTVFSLRLSLPIGGGWTAIGNQRVWVIPVGFQPELQTKCSVELRSAHVAVQT